MARKGENIYKRKDNRWEGRYIKGYQPTGEAQYGYCYAKTYTEVKKKLTEAKSDLLKNRLSTAAKMQEFSYYCDQWLLMNRTRVKESTYVKYSATMEKYIKAKLGAYPVHTLTSAGIEQFGYELLFTEALAPKTVKDVLTILHAVLKFTEKQLPGQMGHIEIIYPKEVKKEMRVLTREEQTQFVSYLTENMDSFKFGVLLALFTGMRIGEVCALRWGDISLKERTIKVSATMQRLRDFSENRDARTKVVISTPKSVNSARVIPLTQTALSLCRNRYSNQPEAFVLTGEAESYIEPRVLQYRLCKFTRDCGLEGVHFHTLRHTFATRCVEVDFELKSLSEILGHASPRITIERYVHSSMELKRHNMNKLAAVGL